MEETFTIWVSGGGLFDWRVFGRFVGTRQAAAELAGDLLAAAASGRVYGLTDAASMPVAPATVPMGPGAPSPGIPGWPGGFPGGGFPVPPGSTMPPQGWPAVVPWGADGALPQWWRGVIP